jgi:hypothetical protein
VTQFESRGVFLLILCSIPQRFEHLCSGKLLEGFMKAFRRLSLRSLICGIAAFTLIGAFAPRAEAQGSLHAWGADTGGLVSNVPAGNDFVKVSIHWDHGLALRSNGTLVSWGRDTMGQVSGTPSGTYVDIATGANGSAALRADGTIAAWGYTPFVPSGSFSRLSPKFLWDSFVAAFREDGTVAATGLSLPSQPYVSVSTDPGLQGFIVALKPDGELATSGTFLSTDSYVIPGPFRAAAAGVAQIVAIRADGTLAQWGSEWFIFPEPPSGTFTALAAGVDFNVALRTDGSLATWGYDNTGGLSGTPSGTGFTAASVGYATAVAIHYEPTSAPDADSDGLTDAQEATLGTNPNLADTDGDGLLDGTEVNSSLTNPLDFDSDNDGLSDGAEVSGGTNPNNSDTDGDGVNDAQDPTPLTPGVPGSWIEQRLRSDASFVLGLSLTCIDAPNANAAKGRRNALANKLSEAANKVAQGDRIGAIDDLTALVDKLDGDSSPPDWMVYGDEKNALLSEVQLIIYLLGQP